MDLALGQFGGASVEWSWRFRILKAQILVAQSDSASALAVLDGDLPASLAGTELAVQKSIFGGIARRIAQDFDGARREFGTAEKLAEESHPRLLSRVLTARGALEIDQSNYKAASEAYNRALILSRQQHDKDLEAAALLDLGRLALIEEKFDDAIDQNQTALSLASALGDQSLVATTLGNLGWSYFQLGDFENALRSYQQAAVVSERAGLTAYRLYWFTGMANSYLAVNNYEAAESLAKSTLQSARSVNNLQTISECLNDLARIELTTGRLTEAEYYNKQAVETGDKLSVLDSTLSAAKIAAAQKRFTDADRFFERVLSAPNVETPLRWQAAAGLAGLREDQRQPVEAERYYRQAINTVENARNTIQHDELRLSFLSSGIAVYGDYIDFLMGHKRPDDALNQADLSRARTLTEGLSTDQVKAPRPIQRIPPQQLAKRLNATLLVYWLGEKHSYLWAITPTKTVYFPLPPASEIDPLIKSYRDLSLKSEDLLQNATAAGEKLYATLIAPAKKLIAPGSRVILLPDTSLYGLNFETLIVPDPQPHYWIEDVTLTTASSLSMLASALNRAPPNTKNLLLLGDAVPVPEFGPLPQAALEIQKIQPYFPEKNRTVLTGPQATPDAYTTSQPGRFAYLHFVTHGTASRARPLESAVVLSKEPASDTYKLYARDIVTHPLHAELVTISACNGSGTRAYSGEGLVGLSWAFLRAGAHNVIGALWEVSDASTPLLMDKMYAELAAGKDPATALRNAKLSLLHSPKVFAKPFYWAPFQLYTGS